MGLKHNLTRNKVNSSTGCGHAGPGTNEIDQDGRTDFFILDINGMMRKSIFWSGKPVLKLIYFALFEATSCRDKKAQ